MNGSSQITFREGVKRIGVLVLVLVGIAFVGLIGYFMVHSLFPSLGSGKALTVYSQSLTFPIETNSAQLTQSGQCLVTEEKAVVCGTFVIQPNK